MELVAGETLADIIARGALPVDEALGIARQIADALEAAHERGVIHRDLKPANIKLACARPTRGSSWGRDCPREAGGSRRIPRFGSHAC
jgi:serine/threonine protein kinase